MKINCAQAVGSICLLFVSSTLIAEQRAAAPEWGTLQQSALVVGSFQFQPYVAGTVVDTDTNSADRWVTSAPGDHGLVAHFHLPTGAVIQGLELEGCNFFLGDLVAVNLFQTPQGQKNLIGSVLMNPSFGCGKTASSFTHTVNGSNGPYLLSFFSSQTDGSQRLTAVRVIYKLQVSPAPATATFSDVPTSHPFFQYIEALAASGITAGCNVSPPMYCPDATLTRGQMAVFLSRALGLHFAP